MKHPAERLEPQIRRQLIILLRQAYFGHFAERVCKFLRTLNADPIIDRCFIPKTTLREFSAYHAPNQPWKLILHA